MGEIDDWRVTDEMKYQYLWEEIPEKKFAADYKITYEDWWMYAFASVFMCVRVGVCVWVCLLLRMPRDHNYVHELIEFMHENIRIVAHSVTLPIT